MNPTGAALSEPAKNLLLVSLLASDKIISNNGKAFLKELILRRDSGISDLLEQFETKEAGDASFMEKLHNLIEAEALALYNELFYDTSLEVGKSLSKDERDENELNEDKCLIYGEVDFTSFYKVLRKINPPQGSTFYDLGSGTAKAIFIARLTQDFGRCLGIEILEGLHNQAVKIVDRYNSKYRSYLCTGLDLHASVHQGSFLEYDWSDGDVVFANSTCFDDTLMEDMSKRAENLRPGAIFITFTKGLTSSKFEVLERKRYRMSWGPATVYIHRRLNHDGSPIGPPALCILPVDNVPYQDDFDMSSLSASGKYETNGHSSSSGSGGEEESDEEEEDDGDYDENNDDDEADDDDDDSNDEEEEEEEEEGYAGDGDIPMSPPLSVLSPPPMRIKTGQGVYCMSSLLLWWK
jgi:SAM-dependent methyltransferase